jgi:hypothetical protein
VRNEGFPCDRTKVGTLFPAICSAVTGLGAITVTSGRPGTAARGASSALADHATGHRTSANHNRNRIAEFYRFSVDPREVMSYVSRLKRLAASRLTLDNTSLQPTRVFNQCRRREYMVAGTL